MKISRKFLLNITVISVIIGSAFAAFVIFGVNPLARELEEGLDSVQPQVERVNMVTTREESIKNIVLVIVPLLGMIYALYLWFYISHQIVKPLTRAVEFSNQLAKGEFPRKLQNKSTSDEIVILTKTLNYLRDRLHNTIMKLEKSHKREQNARQGAEKASNLKSNFLSRLSPELRTPLNAINGYLEVIRADLDKGCYDNLLKQRVENIARNTEILNRQVANLLDIGKLGGEDKYLNVSEFNIGDFMRELLEYSVFCLQEKDITLVNHLSSEAPEKINTDRDVLSLILSTLIRALARVSRPGEVISCGCDAIEDKMVFWVRDNRKAEPYEKLADSFERMVPDADFSKTATPAVLNMMLASTKAASLGAELSAASHEEAACEFALTFNAWDIVNDNLVSAPGVRIISNYDNSVDDERDECVFEDHDRNYDSMVSFKLEAQVCSRNIEILLAEDDSDNARILETLFRADGEKVHTVSNGAQCEAALQEKDYDFLILSFFLPETDIFDLVKEIRKKKSPKELPIIILTGYLSQQDRQRLIVAGVNRCFIKPLNFQQLRRIVKAAV